MFGTPQSDQDVVGREVRDGIRDYGPNASAAWAAARFDANRAHVAKHRVQALVRDVATPVDVVAKPRKPAWQRRREHVDLSRGVEDVPNGRRKIGDIGDSRIRNKEKPLDCQLVTTEIGGGGCDVRFPHALAPLALVQL
jgi:hypothetical protein